MFEADMKRYLYPEDEIATFELGDRYWLRAKLMRDPDGRPPDKHMDGFWPSLDVNDDGWIGLNPKTGKPKSRSTWRRHMARAKAIMKAWEEDDWWWTGVIVEVYPFDAWLESDHMGEPLGEAALWGIECNWPTFKKGQPYDNTYLLTVANDLIGEALQDAGVPRLVATVLRTREEHAGS